MTTKDFRAGARDLPSVPSHAETPTVPPPVGVSSISVCVPSGELRDIVRLIRSMALRGRARVTGERDPLNWLDGFNRGEAVGLEVAADVLEELITEHEEGR